MTASKELLEKRKKLMDDFGFFKRQATKRLAEQKAKRIQLRNGIDTDCLKTKEDEEIEYSVQFLVEIVKEEINE
jgi:translation initiation factor 3 subunit B